MPPLMRSIWSVAFLPTDREPDPRPCVETLTVDSSTGLFTLPFGACPVIRRFVPWGRPRSDAMIAWSVLPGGTSLKSLNRTVEAGATRGFERNDVRLDASLSVVPQQ